MRPSIKPHSDPALVRRALAQPPTAVVVHRLIKQLRAQHLKPGLEECLEAAAAFDGADPGPVCAFFAYDGPNPLAERVGSGR